MVFKIIQGRNTEGSNPLSKHPISILQAILSDTELWKWGLCKRVFIVVLKSVSKNRFGKIKFIVSFMMVVFF